MTPTVHVVVPDGVDDPERPSGGNVYDQRICHGLGELGWRVQLHPAASGSVVEVLAGIPDGSLVLLDGLVAATAPEPLVPAASRLELVVLLHMPLGDEREAAVLSAAAAVVTTSRWSRARVGGRVHVATPGVDLADVAAGTEAGGELLCVAAVIPGKGHDVLLAALAELVDRSWRLLCVGTLARDPAYVEGLVRQAKRDRIEDRVVLAGPLRRGVLEGSYAAADVLVLASRAESYGMVVTEALAHGVPVLATDVGGLPEALGELADGRRPGLLVPPDDVPALSRAIDGWLDDADLRRRLRLAARERRDQLTGWRTTAETISRVLTEVAR